MHAFYKYSINFLVTVHSLPSFSSSYQTWEQSAISSGVAHADMAAGADNASTAYYNPAGMTRLKDAQISAGASWAILDSEVHDAYISSSSSEADGVKLRGDTSDPQLVIPNFYAVKPLEGKLEDWWIGIAVVAPFGGETLYDDQLINLYTEKTYEEAILINPSLAWKATDKFSIGVGLDIQKFTSIYTEKFSLGEEFNIKNKMEFSNWKASWNAGLLYEFTPSTRAGITYRPKIVYDQTGTHVITFSDSENYAKRTSDATSNLGTPAYTSFGVYHDVNEQLALMMTAVYTEWSAVKNVKIQTDNTIPLFSSDINIDFDWENTWYFGVGSTYQMNKCWIVRAGVGYDRSPVINDNRELRVPDGDRLHLALGTGYTFYKNWQIDLAYQFVYAGNNETQNVILPGLEGFYNAQVKTHANILSGQISYVF